MAQHFDLTRFELRGDPFPSPSVLAITLHKTQRVSRSRITYSLIGSAEDSAGRQLLWIDHSGKLEGTVGTPAMYEYPRISPDGKRLAVLSLMGAAISGLSISNVAPTHVSLSILQPITIPCGHRTGVPSHFPRIVMAVFSICTQSSGGTGEDELLLKTSNNKYIDDWSADGKYILYEETDPKTKGDLWLLPLFGDRKPVRLLGTPFNEWEGSFSPDGRWLAYNSDESGTF